MADSQNSPLSLLCEEDDSCLAEQYQYHDENLDLCSVSESESEYVEMLIQKETAIQSNNDDSSVKSERAWSECARRDAVRWIVDVCVSLISYRFCALISLLQVLCDSLHS